MMTPDEMAALEAKLLNNPEYENRLFPDVEVEEEEAHFSSYGSTPHIDINTEMDTSDLNELWKDF